MPLHENPAGRMRPVADAQTPGRAADQNSPQQTVSVASTLTQRSADILVRPGFALAKADKNVRAPQKIATAARGFSFSCWLIAPQTPAPLPLRSQASLAPLAPPRLLRAAPLACSWLTWGQNNPEPKAVEPAGRDVVDAGR